MTALFSSPASAVRRAIVTVWLGFALLPAATASPELQGFKAEYGVQYLHVRAADVSLSLRQLEDKQWSMSRSSRAAGVARWLAGDKLTIDEQSWFTLQDTLPQPTRFELRKPGAKRGRRRVDIAFEQSSATVVADRSEPQTFELSADSQDPVSAVLAVMLTMQTHSDDFKIPVVDRRGEDLLSFKVLERADLKTPAGTFKTLHILQKSKNRSTDYWLALDHDMIPVKISHKEKGEEEVMMLLEKLTQP